MSSFSFMYVGANNDERGERGRGRIYGQAEVKARGTGDVNAVEAVDVVWRSRTKPRGRRWVKLTEA